MTAAQGLTTGGSVGRFAGKAAIVTGASRGIAQRLIDEGASVVITARHLESLNEAVLRRYPLGRLGEPVDVSGSVAFLLSDDAAWITGQLIVIDGGATLTGGVA